MRRRSIITVGKDRAEIKIYTLRRTNGVPSYQCAWYDLGKRQTKTFAEIENAKFFAQQQMLSLRNEGKAVGEASLRDVETLWACESRSQRFGLTLVAAFDEWFAAKSALNGGSVTEAVRFYSAHHAGLPNKSFAVVAEEFYSAKEAAGASFVYCRSLRHYLGRMKKPLGATPLTDITTPQIDAYLRSEAGNHTTRNNLRRILVTVFRWAQKQGYLAQDRKTTPERAMTFSGPDTAPEIFTPDELRKIINVCPKNMLPHIVIGAFSGIRSAEIERLDWLDILWDRGYIEIKAAKAKTKARRLVPLLPNLRAWLEPMKKDEGAVCHCPNTATRLNYIGEKAGFGWRQNALRHSFASYRLSVVQDAAKVALEMGNSPQMLFKHYRELVTPDAATAWFAIMPPKAV